MDNDDSTSWTVYERGLKRPASDSTAKKASLPSSKINKCSCLTFTNPCIKASAKIACVETTIRLSLRAVSQMRWVLHRSTLSAPTSILIFTAGKYDKMYLNCCSQSWTVGTRNQIYCNVKVDSYCTASTHLVARQAIQLGHYAT
jgi:hypothetical protein